MNTDRPPAADPIDGELRPPLARGFGFEHPPETFGTLWERMIDTFEAGLGRRPTVEDLCTTDGSPHRTTVNDATRRYRCATDAFVAAVAADRPATARTVSPVSDTELVVEFDADGAVAAPDGAVLSVGVERSVDPPADPVTPGAVFGQFCPYSHAFPTRREYEEWTAARPGVATDVQTLDRALELQARLFGEGFE